MSVSGPLNYSSVLKTVYWEIQNAMGMFLKQWFQKFRLQELLFFFTDLLLKNAFLDADLP